ncbi:hypothetical protein LCGC14_0680500 [marine sediment metagenome]|uniref:Uncharacterized protein n=1 Tax=marine sediment metagenome TaxID=412755 RepID=A0A0F9R8L2_9ZZZZ|nr:MAG: hypothetical protein Lokiarch_07500 [Candidatus Lokiarchaeum sp. GC14_75]
MKFKIELSRQGNFILAILLIHFVFFGYLSNIFQKDVGEKLLFLYQILFDPSTFISLIILIVIVFIMVLREKFFEYGIRNSIWLTPIIMIQSWIWTWIIYGFDITIIGDFFTRYEGYITILSILGVNLVTAILAAIIKQYIDRSRKLE